MNSVNLIRKIISCTFESIAYYSQSQIKHYPKVFGVYDIGTYKENYFINHDTKYIS